LRRGEVFQFHYDPLRIEVMQRVEGRGR
jgi:hypothetical protein